MTKATLPFEIPDKGDLTTGPVRGHLVRLTVPMIWGIFAILSFQLIDTIYIGRLGPQALAAIAYTFPVTMVIFSLIMGMGIAMSSVLSRQIGARDAETVRRIASHGVFLAFLVGLILAGIGILTHDTLFRAMGAGDDLLPLIHDYMMIWFAGAVFVVCPMVGNSAIRATGDTLTPALIMTIAAVVNIILDPLLIFGLLGFPRMEMQGAALATVIANGMAMVAGLYVLSVKKKLLCLRPQLQLLGDSAKRLAIIAIPAGLTSILQPVTNAILIFYLTDFGAAPVAAFGAASRVEAFLFVIIMALAVGMSPVLGQNWGAKRFDRVHETLRDALRFSAIWSLFIAVLLAIFAYHIARMFTDDPEVIRVMTLFFWIVPISYIAGNLVPGWGSAFNAIGFPQRSFVMLFIKLICLQIPLAWLGHHLYGVVGVFGAIAVTNVVAGTGFHLLNRRFCKKQMEACQG